MRYKLQDIVDVTMGQSPKLYRKQSVSGRRKKQTPVLESLPFPSNCRPIFSY